MSQTNSVRPSAQSQKEASRSLRSDRPQMRVVPLAQAACNRSDDPFDCRGRPLWMDLSPARRRQTARGAFFVSHRLPRSLQLRASAAITNRASAPPNEGCLSLPNCQYRHFVEQRASSPDDRQHTMAHAVEDTIYISMCSGGAIVKISAAERPQFVLGQLTILGVAGWRCQTIGKVR
jgi:hypothetical protein